jgi:hypothetical protein
MEARAAATDSKQSDLEARIAELAAALQAAGEKLGVHEQDTSHQLNTLKTIVSDGIHPMDILLLGRLGLQGVTEGKAPQAPTLGFVHK